MTENQTIFALSSGQPPAAIAIIRISGPGAVEAVCALAGSLPPARHAGLRHLRDPETGELLDEALVIHFPAEMSVTGESLVELHCHGSRAVVRAVEATLASRPALRAAQAGEFTRRAFANGRMDLSAVEGLSDLLVAETAGQRRAALAMMGGALTQQVAKWTAVLRRLAAQVEALLDFSDEGDVDSAATCSEITAQMQAVADELARELARPTAERLRDGVRVVIAGPPNAGKSTLLNRLVGRDAAIVSPRAGTTRDVIEVPLALGGLPFLLADTAGLRGESADEVEQIGMARADAMMAGADIILWLGALADMPEGSARVLPVLAKADLRLVEVDDGPCSMARLAVSAVTGQGMNALVDALVQYARELLPQPGDYALSQRQRQAIARAQQAMTEGVGLNDEILIGECFRAALSALDELTGRVTTEAMLDELFRGFCIGK